MYDSQVAKLEAENEALRSLFPLILKELGNRAYCSEYSSLEFLSLIPEEVRLVIKKKDAEIQSLKDRFDKDDK